MLTILLLVTLVALGGCSAMHSGGSNEAGEFTTSAYFPLAGVAGNPVEVQVAVPEEARSATELPKTTDGDG